MSVQQLFRLSGLLCVLFLVAGCPRDDARDAEIVPPAEDPAIATDDLSADHARAREQYIAAWNGDDVEAVARHFTEDAMAQVGDSMYHGLPEIRRGWLEPNVPIVSNLQTQDDRAAPRDDGLNEEGRYSVRIAPPDTTAFQQTGRYTTHWVRGPDGSLRIQSTTVTADQPQP